LGNNYKKVVDNKSKIIYNTCIDAEKSATFFKNFSIKRSLYTHDNLLSVSESHDC